MLLGGEWSNANDHSKLFESSLLVDMISAADDARRLPGAASYEHAATGDAPSYGGAGYISEGKAGRLYTATDAKD